MPTERRYTRECTALREEWIAAHAERWVEYVRSDRRRQIFSGDAEPGQSDAAVVRADLQKSFQKQLDQPLPDWVPWMLDEFGDLRDQFLDHRNAPGAKYEEHRNKLIEDWNTEWRKIIGGEGENLPPSFREVDLQMYDLPRIDLTNADLQSDPTYSEHSDHRETRLPGARLLRANFCKADLTQACLDGANLTGAHLRGASLVKAKLRGAILERADLRDALLREADLSGANLAHARLEGADLHRAVLDDANLSFATGILFDANSVQRAKFSKPAGLAVRWIFLAGNALQCYCGDTSARAIG
jgi:uncharacterized protein YjbI with pentapeptide repeats